MKKEEFEKYKTIPMPDRVFKYIFDEYENFYKDIDLSNFDKLDKNQKNRIIKDALSEIDSRCQKEQIDTIEYIYTKYFTTPKSNIDISKEIHTLPSYVKDVYHKIFRYINRSIVDLCKK